MGLDIGISVKREESITFKNSLNLFDVEKKLFEFISKELPNSGIEENNVNVSSEETYKLGKVWDFCIHLRGRSMRLEEGGYKVKDVYKVLFDFIYDEIRFSDEITLEVYYSG